MLGWVWLAVGLVLDGGVGGGGVGHWEGEERDGGDGVWGEGCNGGVGGC